MSLLELDDVKVYRSYDEEYLEKRLKHYNALLGREGITKMELAFLDRSDVNRNTYLQPKLYTISADDVERIALLYSSYDYDYECEPQFITNKSTWDESEKDDRDELVAGFKRDRAQAKLKTQGDALQSSNDMVYIRVYFKDKKAFHYFKTLTNAVTPKENKQPNSPADIELCLEECIEDGCLSKNLYQMKNEKLLKKEIKTLTPDKSPQFRTKVKNLFYAKSNKDKKFEVIYSGNIEEICEKRGVIKSGQFDVDNNSYWYHMSNGESKDTWYNALKKLYQNRDKRKNRDTYIDLAMYVAKPVDLPVDRLGRIKQLMESYAIFEEIEPKINVRKVFRFRGFHHQAKKGLPYMLGKKEVSKSVNNIIPHPFDWFYVTNEKECKDFLRDNLTDIEKKNVDQYFKDALVEKQYKEIMEIYENAKN